MKNEPLLTVASITAIVAAVVGALVAFGVPLSEDQQTALLGLAAVVAPFVVVYFARPKVTPNAKVQKGANIGSVTVKVLPDTSGFEQSVTEAVERARRENPRA